MPPFSHPNPAEEQRRQLNRQHWSQTLDSRNLEAARQETDLERDLQLFLSDDVRQALDHLEPLHDRVLMDLGGGLGLFAILAARRGAFVVIADISLPRLREGRELARRAGVLDRVSFVVVEGERLPFQRSSLDRQFTKSVLIHTDLAAATRELAQALRPDGRAAFIEPLTRNPFVILYRRLAAPSIWREITRYFTVREEQVLLRSFTRAGFATRRRRLYFLAFLATPFHYTFPAPRLYRLAELVLLRIDAWLFRLLPGLRRYTWFSLMLIGRRRGE